MALTFCKPQRPGSGAMDMALDGQVPIDAPVAGLDGTTADVADAGAGVDAVDSGAATWSPVRGPQMEAAAPAEPTRPLALAVQVEPAGLLARVGLLARAGLLARTPRRMSGQMPAARRKTPLLATRSRRRISDRVRPAPGLMRWLTVEGPTFRLMHHRRRQTRCRSPLWTHLRVMCRRQPPTACAVNGCAWANPWQAPTGTLGSFSGLALAQDGTTLWAAGQVNATFNFGTDANPGHESLHWPLAGPGHTTQYDIVLLKLDPTTGLATAAFDFGDPSTTISLALRIHQAWLWHQAGTWA